MKAVCDSSLAFKWVVTESDTPRAIRLVTDPCDPSVMTLAGKSLRPSGQ
jgi:hypothetical protein